MGPFTFLLFFHFLILGFYSVFKSPTHNGPGGPGNSVPSGYLPSVRITLATTPLTVEVKPLYELRGTAEEGSRESSRIKHDLHIRPLLLTLVQKECVVKVC